MGKPEFRLHRAVAAYLDSIGIVHRPGLEGVLTKQQRILMSQVGLRRGWPDIHIATRPPANPDAHVWIELKAAGGRRTSEQVETMAWLERQGDIVATCRSVDDVRELVRRLGYLG